MLHFLPKAQCTVIHDILIGLQFGQFRITRDSLYSKTDKAIKYPNITNIYWTGSIALLFYFSALIWVKEFHLFDISYHSSFFFAKLTLDISVFY